MSDLEQLSYLERALFEGVATTMSEETGHEVTTETVADTLAQRHGVPSDYFFAAYDSEVSDLTARFKDATR